MSVSFDPIAKLIIADTGTTSLKADFIYSRWKDFARANPGILAAFRVVGGDELGVGLTIPSYFFLINGWRIRPYEGNHELTIDGNLFTEGGVDSPVVPTVGTWNVAVKYIVPMMAQTVSGAAATHPVLDKLASMIVAAPDGSWHFKDLGQDVWGFNTRTLTNGQVLLTAQQKVLVLDEGRILAKG